MQPRGERRQVTGLFSIPCSQNHGKGIFTPPNILDDREEQLVSLVF